MGSATGPKRNSTSYKSRKWYAYLEWSISYPNNTQATISATLYFRGNSDTWGQVGKYCSGAISIGGTQRASFSAGSQSWLFSNITSKQVLTASATINRTTASQNIAVSGWVNLSSSSAYHSSSGASTASGTQAVSARPAYTVTFANGYGGTHSTATVYYGYTTTFPAISRTGYTFNKWNGSYAAGATTPAITANTTYTAYWIENTATLTYNTNGHGTAPSSQTMQYTQAATATNMTSVPGCTFLGWNTVADGSGVGYIPYATVKQADVDPSNTTLYAQWNANNLIRFKINNEWVLGELYIKNNIWKPIDKIYMKVNDIWETSGYPNGENLLLDTKMDDRSTFVNSSDADFSKPLRFYNGDASIHNFQLIDDDIYQDTVTLNSAANLGIAFARLATDMNLDSNSYYTLSCYASCTKSGAHLDIGLSYYNTANTWVWRGGSNAQYFTGINTVQRFALTFKPDVDTQAIMYCFTVLGVAGGTDTFTIYNCKLEKGSLVTDWLPSLDD